MKYINCDLCGEKIEADFSIDIHVDGFPCDVCIWCGMVMEMTAVELNEHLVDKDFHEHYNRIVAKRLKLRNMVAREETR